MLVGFPLQYPLVLNTTKLTWRRDFQKKEILPKRIKMQCQGKAIKARQFLLQQMLMLDRLHKTMRIIPPMPIL